MKRGLTLSVGLAITSLIVLFSGAGASAQASNQPAKVGNGLRISPVRNDLTLKPGSSQTVDIYVQNITNTANTYKGIVNDFVASGDESGEPRILLNENDSAPSHGLKQYVDKVSNVTLQPQEQKVVKVRIAIPANAAGGGYYGAVRFVSTSADDSKNVSLSASVGSLFLVTVPGDVKEQLGVAGFNVARGDKGKASTFFNNSKDLNAVIRFKNSGNVQTAPFGKLILKKSGTEVASYEINDTVPRGNVLPDSIRKFKVGLNKDLGFGKYKLEGNFGYGSQGQLISVSSSFWVVPMAYVIGLIVLVLLVIAAIVAIPRMLKRHDRKLLRKVRGRGKR